MTTIEVNLPDDLAKLAQEAASKLETSLDQIVTLALSAQLKAGTKHDDLESRAKRGRPEDLRDILARVPDVPAIPGDEL